MDNDLLNNLQSQYNSLSSYSFTISILLAFALSSILSLVYKKKSHTLSNPESLARILPLLSIATTLIIAVVKSSLALSLGLVGALSIVRFRTPIKEPEELTYIFLSIGIGLAAGADQYKAAILGLFLFIGCIYLYNFLERKKSKQNLVRLSVSGISNNQINNLLAIISENCSKVNFNNMYFGNNGEKDTKISLLILPRKFEEINTIANKISKDFPSASVSIIDSEVY